jgi:hypothetical protein
LISTNSQGQSDANIKLSKPYPVIDGKKHYFRHEDFFYTIKAVDWDIVLQKFDPDLPKLVQTQTFNRAIKAGSALETVLEFQGKVYIFFSRYKGANKRQNLEATHYTSWRTRRLSEAKSY